MNMKKNAFAVVAVAVLFACFFGTSPVLAKEEEDYNTNYRVPFAGFFFDECASGVDPFGVPWQGENVLLVGEVEVHDRFDRKKDGGYVVHTLYKPVGVDGVGASSGAIYKGSGFTDLKFVFEAEEASSLTTKNRFVVKTKGQDNDYFLFYNIEFCTNSMAPPP